MYFNEVFFNVLTVFIIIISDFCFILIALIHLLCLMFTSFVWYKQTMFSMCTFACAHLLMGVRNFGTLHVQGVPCVTANILLMIKKKRVPMFY